MTQDVETGMRCIKYMLFTTNFMFAMIGFLLIAVGTTITAIYSDFELFMENHFFSVASLLIAIGVFIFIVAFFGCFGAIKQSTALINIYALMLAIILILEISAAIAAYSMRGNIECYVQENMRDSLEGYKTDQNTKDTWDFVQERFECCGIKSPDDWKPVLGTNIYPETCNDTIKPAGKKIYEYGCLDQVTFIARECATLLGTGAICVAIVQLLGVVFGGMLAKSIRRLKTERAVQRLENQRFYAQLANANAQKPTPVIPTTEEVKEVLP